jgi:hypothetical protein
MTTKKSVAAVATALYELLEPLEEPERQRAVSAAAALLGSSLGLSTQAAPAIGPATSPSVIVPTHGAGPAAFFNGKDPHSKIEELAVAARYRESELGTHTHTKEELQAVFRDARRNFDIRNFARDIDNARTKGLFTRDKEITLAYYGQQYVDALPDRDAAKTLRRPKKVKSRGRATKKGTA